jgi:hypothetical protein
MFGNKDEQTTVGAPVTQNPSMLDNVSAQDFNGNNNSATQQTADPGAVGTSHSGYVKSDDKLQPEHPITTDNPFTQTSVASLNDDTTATNDDTALTNSISQKTESESVNNPTGISAHNTPTIQPSGPVNPPSNVPPSTANDNTSTDTVDDASSSDDDEEDSSVPAVDTNKLAGIKQQALEHLEPLVGHLEQNPEEEFKTTMMMIQANDNHTLLDKALTAAKAITDDKERAQALLDIINEINYFSQFTSEDDNP